MDGERALSVAPFDGKIWCLVSAAAGFLAGLSFVALFSVADRLWSHLPTDLLIVQALLLLAISALLSLPALAQQLLLRQAGVRVPLLYVATVIGGWAMLAAIIEALLFVDSLESAFRPYGIEPEILVIGGGPLLGAAFTGFLQACAMPASIRRFYRIAAPPGAAAALVATVLLLAILLFGFNAGDVGGLFLVGLAFAGGWGLYAAITGWPIHRGLRRMAG